MASRTFCIPGILFLFAAFVLNLLVSISLPALPALDIVRSHFTSPSGHGLATVTESSVPNESIDQIRYGIWAYCIYNAQSNDRTCVDPGHGYTTQVHSGTSSVTIKSSWTRGLAVHPVAAAVTFIALVFGFSTHITLTLISSLTAFLAALLTLIAFAIDIALYAFVHDKQNNLSGVHVRTVAGPGFWITLAALLLLLLGGCTVCFGRRRERMSGATSYGYPSKPGVFGRLRTPFRRRGNAV
ncbi:pali-domain-containing protein [Artomyces pyxidatus]|uniref:Pali-domain-containing protein n=1 Tax=Artomyces pyxidatus TaxID=48021 RepID=A0ACB8TLK7_9AGAM|nr:pali-domain-containing protein [Artomyces pyxidatus]